MNSQNIEKQFDAALINGMRLQFYDLGKFSVSSVPSSGAGVNTLGKLTVGIVNLAFACELSLKYLIYSKYGTKVTGHDLEKLFEDLPIELQEKIKLNYLDGVKNHYLSQPPNFIMGDNLEIAKIYFEDFEESLKKTKVYFQKYRYYFEFDKINFEFESEDGTKKTIFYDFDYRFLLLFYKAIDVELDSKC